HKGVLERLRKVMVATLGALLDRMHNYRYAETSRATRNSVVHDGLMGRLLGAPGLHRFCSTIALFLAGQIIFLLLATSGALKSSNGIGITVEDLLATSDLLPQGILYLQPLRDVSNPTTSELPASNVVLQGLGSSVLQKGGGDGPIWYQYPPLAPPPYPLPPGNPVSPGSLRPDLPPPPPAPPLELFTQLDCSGLHGYSLAKVPIIGLKPGQHLTLSSLSVSMVDLSEPLGPAANVLMTHLSPSGLVRVPNGATLTLLHVTLLLPVNDMLAYLSSLGHAISAWPYSTAVTISENVVYIGNLTTTALALDGSDDPGTAGGVVHWSNVTIKCPSPKSFWDMGTPVTVNIVMNALDLTFISWVGPVFVGTFFLPLAPDVVALPVSWEQVLLLEGQPLWVMLGNPQRTTTLDLSGVEGAWVTSGYVFSGGLFAPSEVAYLFDLTLVNLPYTVQPKVASSLLALSLQSFHIDRILSGLGPAQLVLKRCTIVVPDQEVAFLERAVLLGTMEAISALFTVFDVQLPVAGVLTTNSTGGGQLLVTGLRIGNQVSLVNCTLLSASRYSALPGAQPLLPSSLVWPPEVLHGDVQVAAQWGPLGVAFAQGIQDALSNLDSTCGPLPAGRSPITAITRCDDQSIPALAFAATDEADTIRVSSGGLQASASECIVGGYPLARGRTFVDLKGTIGRVELQRPITLRNLVLYNLAPGGMYPLLGSGGSSDGSGGNGQQEMPSEPAAPPLYPVVPGAYGSSDGMYPPLGSGGYVGCGSSYSYIANVVGSQQASAPVQATPQLEGADAAWTNSSLPLWFFRMAREPAGVTSDTQQPQQQPLLVLENVTLVIPEVEWRAVAALLMQSFPAVEAQQQRRNLQEHGWEAPHEQLQQPDLTRRSGKKGEQQQGSMLPGAHAVGKQESKEVVSDSDAGDTAVMQRQAIRRLLQLSPGSLASPLSGSSLLRGIADSPLSEPPLTPMPMSPPAPPLSPPTYLVAPPPPSLPVLASPPSPPYEVTAGLALLEFAAASQVLSYNYDAGELVLAVARHYGWVGTNVTLTYKLPADAPSSASLLSYPPLVLSYQDLAVANGAMEDHDMPPLSGSGSPSPAPQQQPDHGVSPTDVKYGGGLPPAVLPQASPPFPAGIPTLPLPSGASHPSWVVPVASSLAAACSIVFLGAAALLVAKRRRRMAAGAHSATHAAASAVKLELHGKWRPDFGGSSPTSCTSQGCKKQAKEAGGLSEESRASMGISAGEGGQDSQGASETVTCTMALATVTINLSSPTGLTSEVGATLEGGRSGSKLSQGIAGVIPSMSTAGMECVPVTNSLSLFEANRQVIRSVLKAAGPAPGADVVDRPQQQEGRLHGRQHQRVEGAHGGSAVGLYGPAQILEARTGEGRLVNYISSNARLEELMAYYIGLEGRAGWHLTAYQPSLKEQQPWKGALLKGSTTDEYESQPLGPAGAPRTAVVVYGKQLGTHRSMQDTINAIEAELRDPDLHVHSLLGIGAYGLVYGGTWRGLPVAIKVLVVSEGPMGQESHARHRAVMEAAISMSLTHPNIVATYAYDIKALVFEPRKPGAADLQATSVAGVGAVAGDSHGDLSISAGSYKEGVAAVDSYKLYIVQELCNAGTLRQALDHGVAGSVRACGLLRVLALRLALDVAQGMRHIHGCRIVHGDLKSDNVLLAHGPRAASLNDGKETLDHGPQATPGGETQRDTAVQPGAVQQPPQLGLAVATAAETCVSELATPEEGKGELAGNTTALAGALAKLQLTAKVADFGLSLPLPEGATHASQRFQGTPAYMAPEVALVGHMSPRADVWSFGLLLLELYYGCTVADMVSVQGEGGHESGAAEESSDMGFDKNQVQALVPILIKDMVAAAHVPYAKLVTACLASDPRVRPDFGGIIQRLEQVLDAVEPCV
ncbi:hypothetical protein Agub_g7776, partial [Astrephomene gubernaculifera]